MQLLNTQECKKAIHINTRWPIQITQVTKLSKTLDKNTFKIMKNECIIYLFFSSITDMDSLMKDTHYKKEEDDGDEGERFTQEFSSLQRNGSGTE